MKQARRTILAVAVSLALTIGTYGQAFAHCDTLDGPVVEDARKALAARDVTPVLKWVQAKDEKAVQAVFSKAVAAQGKKQKQVAEKKFFESLVRIHRAGEGAPFTGLKPAGEVEPVIVQADRALRDGSPVTVISMVTDTVSRGIRQRYEKVAEALKHKDESVSQGREYVAAYVEYTHYIEGLQQAAEAKEAHHAAPHRKHEAPKHEHGH